VAEAAVTIATPASALVCIDLQQAILAGLAGPEQPRVDQALEELLARVATLQAAARSRGVPLIHVQHDGAPGHRLAPAGPGWPFRREVAPRPGERVVHKRSCDAFHETDLLAALEACRARRLLVAGCMTQYCVDTTCRRAVSQGFDVLLASDGHLNAGSAGLSFRQVIDHHNETLDGFQAGRHAIRVAPLAELVALL
jgi:nicotinamidase-related amidase